MFKSIPGNREYVINLNGEIKTIDGSECTLTIDNEVVTLLMYEKERKVDKKWLALISHFEIELPEKYIEELFYINFYKIKKALKDSPIERILSISGKTTVFRRPLTILGKYRIIPNFTHLAVSKEGEVINVHTHKSIYTTKKTNEYPFVTIYDPDKTKIRVVKLHRLVALAWCNNKDPYGNNIINHKNGDKSNCHAFNLEWCNYSENAVHAFKTGLREDNIPCRVLDTLTQKEYSFHSIAEASRAIVPHCKSRGLVTTQVRTKRPTLINNRYEIKLKGDNSPWFYLGVKNPKKIGKYVTTVTDPDGNVSKYYDTRDLVKAYSLWNTSSIEAQITKFKNMYPEHKIEYTDTWGSEIVQALNIDTGIITEAPTVLAMSRLINIPRHEIMNLLLKGEQYTKNGFAYRRKTDKEWNKNFAIKTSSSVCIQATNLKTQEVINLPSLREAARFFKTDRSTIKYRIRTGKSLSSWEFKKLNTDVQ